MGRLRLVLCLVITLIALDGCRDTDDAESQRNSSRVSSGALKLAPDAMRRLGISVTSSRRESIAVTKSAVGWLETPPSGMLVVRSPVTGFIVARANEAWPVLGQEVQANSKLAAIDVFLTPQEVSQLVMSKEDNDAQMHQALTTMQLSEAHLNQVSKARDAVTGVRIDQLKEALAHSQVAYKEARDKLPYLIQESDDGMEVTPVDVVTTTPGRLLQVHVVPGQFVVSGDPLFTVEDWSTLWIRVPLFEQDARRCDSTRNAVVRQDNTGLTRLVTRITVPIHSNPLTHTVDFLYAIDNPDWNLRVGESCSIEIPTADEREAILVPRSAVLYNNFGQTSCFVASNDSPQFVRTRIELGARHDDSVEVIRGLDLEQVVVSVGAEQLAAEESKSDLVVEDDD